MNELSPSDIEDIVSRHYHGHLGCSLNDKPYVVPISYVFHENALYAYTHAGKKVDILRKNPNVCVQINDITDDRWKSVVIEGVYEELSGDDRKLGIKLLGQKVSEYHEHLPFIRTELIPEKLDGENPAILYRISITSMSGRSFV